MTLLLQHTLPKSTTDAIVQHLNSNILPQMYQNNKRGTYAPGRNEAWLNVHTPLTEWDENTPIKGQFAPGIQDERLWGFCQRIGQRYGGFLPNTGLAVFGEAGITLHRDSAALTPAGITINLGGTNFLYSDTRDDTGDIKCYTLNPGDVVSFNSKHRHAVPEPQPGRWAIILWRVQPNKSWIRQRFQAFVKEYPHLTL